MTPNDRAPKLGKKPRAIKNTDICEGDRYPIGLPGIDVYMTSNRARRVGKWLIKAADYLDSKKVRRER